jgi:rhamnosyltransferase
MSLDDLDNIAVIGPALGDESPSGKIEEVDMVISSGSLVNLSIWDELDGFAGELFVDEVDHEYCLRAKTHDYRVVRMGNIVLPHVPGESRTVAGGKVVDWHSPQRLYYIARNYWYLRKRYSQSFPHVIAGRKRLVLAKFKAYLRYHPHKLASIGALLKGTLHGILGRFGR